MALCVDGPGGWAGWVLLFLLPKADTEWTHKRPIGLRSPDPNGEVVVWIPSYGS